MGTFGRLKPGGSRTARTPIQLLVLGNDYFGIIRRSELSAIYRRKCEFLAAYSRLQHKSADTMHKYGHALSI